MWETGIRRSDLAIRKTGACERATGDALEVVVREGLDGFWVHLDVDVLDDDLMPAVDYQTPGVCRGRS